MVRDAEAVSLKIISLNRLHALPAPAKEPRSNDSVHGVHEAPQDATAKKLTSRQRLLVCES